MLPSVEITKVDGRTGVVRPSAVGVLAIVAAAASGAMNSAVSHARQDLLAAEYGGGHLAEFGAYAMSEAGKPVVAVRGDASTAGDYSTPAKTGGGTSVITEGGSEPFDDYDVLIEFIAAGTIGVAGITYRYSLDGGQNKSKVLALGTANTITIPGTGVSVALGAGTVAADTKVSFTTSAAKLTNADLPAALEALRVTSSPYDAVLIDLDADDDTVGICDLWLKELAKKGKFKTVILTARPRAADETETEYKDALAALFASAASTDVVVCADRADVVSQISGIVQPRPTGLFVAARGMRISRGTDAAWVDLGPLGGNVRITDDRGNPKFHDESNFPGLDDIRLTTLRTLDGFEGTYITNARILAASGSDFVYWQHARTLNRGAEITYQTLTRQLSRGVRKNPKAGPAGERYIAEEDAQLLEGLANAAIGRELVATGEVDDMRATLSRTDDIRSNEGAEITVQLEAVALGYVKKFKVAAGFVTEIKAPAQAGL